MGGDVQPEGGHGGMMGGGDSVKDNHFPRS